ncbi:MAG: LPS export ABC transporter periplasmic protein LptC [Candidatus Omnitrophota bacterium]
MLFKRTGLIAASLFFIYAIAVAQETAAPAKKDASVQDSDQQISEFSLSGYGEKGVKAWDLAGKTADIFTDVVKLQSVIGNLYGKEEDIKLTADSGDFNKTDGKVHLEKNVVITTTTGTKLTTDSLNWDRRGQVVTTKDYVNIQRENMVASGKGAVGEMGLKQVSLQKDVQVDILPEVKEGRVPDPKDKTVITCDGQLEIDYDKNVAVFKDNVKVERPDSTIYSDRMDIYFIPSGKEASGPEKSAESNTSPSLMGSKIDKIFAKGNVKVLKGENITYSDTATYTSGDKKVVLTGRPKLIIYSTEDFQGASFGN